MFADGTNATKYDATSDGIKKARIFSVPIPGTGILIEWDINKKGGF